MSQLINRGILGLQTLHNTLYQGAKVQLELSTSKDFESRSQLKRHQIQQQVKQLQEKLESNGGRKMMSKKDLKRRRVVMSEEIVEPVQDQDLADRDIKVRITYGLLHNSQKS